MLVLIQEEQIPKQMLPVECVATILSSIEVGFTFNQQMRNLNVICTDPTLYILGLSSESISTPTVVKQGQPVHYGSRGE